MNFGNQVDRIKQKPAAKAKHEKKAKKKRSGGRSLSAHFIFGKVIGFAKLV